MPLPCFHHEGSSTAYLRRSLDCTSLALFVRGGGPGLLKHNRCLPKLTPIPCPSLSLFLSPPFSRSFFHPLSLTFSLTFSLFSLSLSLILSLSLSSLFSLSLSLFHSPAPLSFSLSPTSYTKDWYSDRVRQLRHHVGPFLTHFSAQSHHPLAV